MTQDVRLRWFPSLMYHRIVREAQGPDPHGLRLSVADFESQLSFLKRHGYRSVSVEEAVAQALGRSGAAERSVAITFDDGYMDFVDLALPLLLKYGFTATVFLVSGRLGGSNTWDHDVEEPVDLMGPREISEARSVGIMFGSHSRTHPRLASLDRDEARREVAESRDELEQALGHEVTSFCYPYGSSSPEVRRMVMEAGYSVACGIGQREHTTFNLNRIDVSRCAGTGLRWRFALSGRLFRTRQLTGMGRGGRRLLRRLSRQPAA